MFAANCRVAADARAQGCIGIGEVPPPPPSRALGLCPATVPLTASAGLNGSCNRQ